MNKFLEALVMMGIFTLFIILVLAMIIPMFILNNNIDQEHECDKMKDYGYVTILEKSKFVFTCYIIMEDGIKIRSYDYVISDNRKPRMITKQDALRDLHEK